MKRYRYCMASVLLCLCLFFGGVSTAKAEETVSQNEASDSYSVSDDNIRDEDDVSGNDTEEVSENETPQITIACNVSDRTGRGAVVSISADSTGSYIALIQAENKAAGVRKTLYKSLGTDGDKDARHVDIEFKITADGTYIFYAYDSEVNVDKGKITISGITKPELSVYADEAEENRRSGEREIPYATKGEDDILHRTLILGGGGDQSTDPADKAGQSYTVKSGNTEGDSDEPGTDEKYGSWSMLKVRDKKDEYKAWYEPYTDTGETAAPPQPIENILDLSDYEVTFFSEELLNEPEGVLGETEAPVMTIGGGLKSAGEDDNIADMDNNNPVILTGIIVFVIILIMLLAAFKLMKW